MPKSAAVEAKAQSEKEEWQCWRRHRHPKETVLHG
jgi:hypothetical protein